VFLVVLELQLAPSDQGPPSRLLSQEIRLEPKTTAVPELCVGGVELWPGKGRQERIAMATRTSGLDTRAKKKSFYEFMGLLVGEKPVSTWG
jgi:hypothetical protein